MFLLILESKGREGGVGRGEKNINVREKHHWLPPVHALARDRIRNLGTCSDRESNPQPLLVYGTMLQLTEPPGQG